MKKLALDAADIRILSAVQKHGALSKSKLADIVNLSATPCWARFTKLKNAGLIKSYGAEITLDRITDYTKVIVTLSLNKHRKTDFDRFEAFVGASVDITECVATGGGTDYVMTVMSPSLTAFQALMNDMLEGDLAIDRYMTYIVTREIKSAAPNIERLMSDTVK
jgi:Lrp/AsnC family transcriptional regulator of ectoine degradation